MNVKKTVKKIVALGAGAGLVGATLMGAMAQDLSDFPANMMAGGQFDGKIVLGADAKTEDLIGAVDIAAGLQAASTSDVAVGDSVTSIDVEGDAAQIRESGDALEIGENIADVVGTLTDEDLALLADGRLTTQKGSTDYTQTIEFNSASDIRVQLDENENNDDVGTFLYVEDGDELFTYEIDFSSGFESDIDSDDTTLEDFEDDTLVFMGQEYSIVRATTDNTLDGRITLELIAGDISDTLQVGDTKTYTVDGVDYEVTVVIIGNDGNVKFLVNNEATSSMAAGDTETLDSGLEIGVREVISTTQYLESQPGSVVEFYLGANKVVLEDTDVANAGGGSIEVDDEDLDDITFEIEGTVAVSDVVEINSMTYTINAEADDRGIWAAPGEGIRAQLDDENVLLNPSLDLYFAGLTEPSTTDILFRASGDEAYYFEFTNVRGTEYEIPYLYADAVGDAGFGEDSDGLFVFWESLDATNTSDLQVSAIDLDDYVLLTDNMDQDSGESFVLQLDEIDTDDDAEELIFVDVSSGDEIVADYDSWIDTSDGLTAAELATPSGELRVGGNEFDFWLLDNTSVLLDLNADGAIAGNDYSNATDLNDASGDEEIINVVVRGGGFIALAGTADVPFVLDDDIVATLTTDEDELDEGSSVVTTMTFSHDDTNAEWDADITDSTEELNDDDSALLTRYGAYVVQEGDDDGADSITIEYPSEQVEALVYVLGGDYETTTSVSGGAAAQRVNILDVGLAVLDTEVSLDQTNLIVVGGPCVNTVAAELLEVVGNADCAEGFQPGEGMVRLFNTGDHIAMLVAGYSAQDTVQTAAKVHEAATGTVEGFEGDSVVVTIAGQNDVTVRAATPAPAADEDME